MNNYIEYKGKQVPIRAWTRYVPVASNALDQLKATSELPFIHSHIAVMPDVHWGMGATVGSVIPTDKAIIPAAVGVDIGCGMMATKLSGLTEEDLPDSLVSIRNAIEDAVPVGFNQHDNPVDLPIYSYIEPLLKKHEKAFEKRKQHPEAIASRQFGTLGGGNHFIELCIDTESGIWIMLHSGSRGIGNAIGNYFIQLAKEDMRIHEINLPDKNLAYLREGTEHFKDYWQAMMWAQDYARANRERMMKLVLNAIRDYLPEFTPNEMAVNCHHNYVEREHHFGKDVYLTRKGAVRAGEGDLGIIPGSMGARSFIVRGLGNPDSFHSCSHGAGRVMSRSQAKREISLEQHIQATKGVECRKDKSVLDESPAAYKNIEDVMRSQEDLVEILYELKQVLCVKG